MIEVGVTLRLDGADEAPMLHVALELERLLAGMSFSITEQAAAGGVAHRHYIIIDSAEIGDFETVVDDA